jgi:hypothetical protein
MQSLYVTDRYQPEDIKVEKVGFTLVFTTDDGEFCSTNPRDLNAIKEDIEESIQEGWYFHGLYLNGNPMKFQIVTLLTEMEEM